MIPKTTKMRVARPTDNLVKITDMYINGLGFKLLGRFEGHNGFDGSIIGHEQHNYHLEFTHHKGTTVGKAPTQDNLIIFYVTDAQVWQLCCEKMLSAGFVHVQSYNDYWDVIGKTFEDIDGYRVVLQNREWTA